ncbi:NAD(P)/FAD-dependent oxidoreductase [Cohnella thermotolerans]|uniref:NAD(P)/FAD-dependent oxidoreductase n=1 Tax=Cohnella thermotolerans TaxID=329858 RepID=UPI000418AF23|nr:NAD(P)/FAD-dependent oxidoreductase [Cohnella thermotolerans]
MRDPLSNHTEDIGKEGFKLLDCAIIGGGPAGLSAALVLGRARRSTVLFDDGKPRNAVTRQSHGFLTRDGVTPAEFREAARRDIAKYDSVEFRSETVASVGKERGRFVVRTASGGAFEARKIILATGLKETLPDIGRIAEYYGTSLFSCPYCDGWEMRDRPLVVIANDASKAAHMAQVLSNWSRDLLVCTNGSRLTAEQREALALHGIRYKETGIRSLEGEHGRLERVRFEDGASEERTGGIVVSEWRQAADFAMSLGCRMNETGGIAADEARRTNVEGVFAAGDAAVISPAQLIVAAADGARAAIGVNSDLTHESFHPPVPH